METFLTLNKNQYYDIFGTFFSCMSFRYLAEIMPIYARLEFNHLRKQKEETNIQAQTNSSQLHKDSKANKIL